MEKRKNNISFDAYTLFGRSGNGTYTRELLKSLCSLQKDNLFFYTFIHDLFRNPFPIFPVTHTWQKVPLLMSATYFPRIFLRVVNSFLIRTHARFYGVQIYHATNPLNILSGPFKTVVTIHDMAPFYEDGWVKSETRGMFEQLIPDFKKADAIIAVSEYTKADIIKYLRVPAEKISVIYEAADSVYFKDFQPEIVYDIVGDDSPYLLYVGQLQPRKNIGHLIRAFGKLQISNPKLKLVLVGALRDEKYGAELQALVSSNHESSAVIFAGVLPDETVRALYSGTACFVYPSLFEGFGLPVLEAMQCGAPVVASNATSLPEVVGDAGVLCDPQSVESIYNSINGVLNHSEGRDFWRAKSLIRAKNFSWEKAATETSVVYDSI